MTSRWAQASVSGSRWFPSIRARGEHRAHARSLEARAGSDGTAALCANDDSRRARVARRGA